MKHPALYFGAAATLAAFAFSNPALAQTGLGKTVKAHYTVHTCATTNSFCAPLQTASGNFYISPQKNIFDYTGSQQGDEFIVGVPKFHNGATITWLVQGNTISLKADVAAKGTAPAGSTTTIYNLRGNSCVMSMRTTFKNVSNQVETQSCTVSDGNANQ